MTTETEQPDQTDDGIEQLILTDEGVLTPDRLVGRTGKVTVEKPTLRIDITFKSGGVREVEPELLTFPPTGEKYRGLDIPEGHVRIEGVLYEVVDDRDLDECPHCGSDKVAATGDPPKCYGCDEYLEEIVTDGGRDVDPSAFRLPTIDELDAMRVDHGLSQQELSRRAGMESGRFNHILHNDIDPRTSTMRSFLEVLQETDRQTDADLESKRGPKPKPSSLADQLSDTDPVDVGPGDESLRTDGGETGARTASVRYRCEIHDFEARSKGQIQQHIDHEHPGGMAKDSVEEFRVDDSGPAVYECICGEQMTFHPDEFRRLHWLKRRFEFKNVSEAIGDIRRCCPTPEYMEVSGYPGGEPDVE